jgi:hypothetical protein
VRDAAVDVEEDFRREGEQANGWRFIVGGLLKELGR